MRKHRSADSDHPEREERPSMSDTANALMQEELQRQLLQQQHQRQMQEIQAQHDLQMQMLQEQQRLFLEQQQRLEADHQRAEQERQKQRTAARSKATDAAPMAHLVKTYPAGTNRLDSWYA
jgi:membrane protein involved in colicin uptake